MGGSTVHGVVLCGGRSTRTRAVFSRSKCLARVELLGVEDYVYRHALRIARRILELSGLEWTLTLVVPEGVDGRMMTSGAGDARIVVDTRLEGPVGAVRLVLEHLGIDDGVVLAGNGDDLILSGFTRFARAVRRVYDGALDGAVSVVGWREEGKTRVCVDGGLVTGVGGGCGSTFVGWRALRPWLFWLAEKRGDEYTDDSIFARALSRGASIGAVDVVWRVDAGDPRVLSRVMVG